MNIFFLNRDPVVAAQQQCNKHVCKMVLESAQLLSGAFEPGVGPYKRTHYNHPCSKWARKSKDNYEWLLAHAKALSLEYTHRYEKIHKCDEKIDWCANNYGRLNLPSIGLTEFPQCMPDEYKRSDPIEAYHLYYIYDKSRFAKWTRRSAPNWFINPHLQTSNQDGKTE